MAKKNSGRLQDLHRLGVSLSGDSREVFDQIAAGVARVFGLRTVSIEKLEGDRAQALSFFHDGRLRRDVWFELSGTARESVRSEKKRCRFADAKKRFPNDRFLQEENLDFYLGFPVLGRSGEVLAILDLLNNRPVFLSEEETGILELLSTRIALELEKVEKKKEQKEAQNERLSQLETLGQVAARIASFLSLDELLPYVVGLLHDQLGYYQVHIFLLDEQAKELVVMAGKGAYKGTASTVGRRLPVGKGINGKVVQAGQPYLANDVINDPAFSYVDELPDTRSELTVPLKVEGKILGTLDVQSSQRNAFSPTDVLTLQILADQVSIAITNARLFENSRRQNVRLSILNRLSAQISSNRNKQEVMGLIVESSRKLLSSSRALLFTFSGSSPSLFEMGLAGEALSAARRLVSAAGQAENKLLPLWVKECRYYDLSAWPDWPADVVDALESLGLARFFGAPLLSREGKLLALLLISAENTQEAPENFLRLVQAFAYQSGTALESAFLIEELTESEAQFSDLYENAPDMYQTLNASGVVVVCNRTEERVLGVSKGEILERPFSIWVHPDSKDIWEEHVQWVARSEEESSCPVKLALPQGGVLEADVHSRRFLSKTGEVLLRSVLRDVTEKRKLERQLLQSQKMESIGTLAAGIAHEFNNLLGGILGHASLGREIGQVDQMQKDLGQIVKITERAQKLVQNLLSFSKKIEEETWLPVKINKVLEEAAGLLAQELRNQNIQLIWELEEVPSFLGHYDQLVQVFLNLFINAIHAIAGGGRLTVSTSDLDGVLRVSVADTGCGIPPENLSKIFDPFFSTKGVYGDGTHPGAGLGLTVCYNVVSSHGGEIEVASEVDKGSTFTLTFPVKRQLIKPHPSVLPFSAHS